MRDVYSGELTYGANCYREYLEVEFWDQLDYIGIHAYFSLTGDDDASIEELEQGWLPHLDQIDRLYRRYRLQFSSPRSAIVASPARPSRPPTSTVVRPVDLQEQANAYEAMFRVFWDREWFSGLYQWNWLPDNAHAGEVTDNDYTPQNKPAMQRRRNTRLVA